MLIRSISGLRGTVGIDQDGLTPALVARYAASFASYHGNKGSIALGYDGRRGGQVFYEIALNAVRSSGCGVVALGMVPTPTVMNAVETREDIKGGIIITASHNPGEWNGMKFIAESGLFLDLEENEAMWKIYDEKTEKIVEAKNFGELRDGTEEIQKHIDAVLAIPFIDLPKIRARKFKVVLDAVNASGSFIHPKLLREFGCEVIEIACDGSGDFPHKPEPVPSHLSNLSKAVVEHRADLGIAVDPDADRLVLVMENGEPFVEENTIVLAAEQVLKHSGKGEKVVVNLSTTRAIEDIAETFGAEVIRTPVGEINVSKRMKSIKAVIGGEGSGGVILPAVHLGRDSLVGIALALGALADFGGSISKKKKSMPQYEIEKSKIDLRSKEEVTAILEKLKSGLGKEAKKVNTDDGLRLDFEKCWLHVRSSNTEPIIRLIAEAPTADEARQLIARAQEAL